jgi:hypothetical protein
MPNNHLSRSLLDRLVIIGPLNRRLKMPLLWWGLAIFAGYYMVPLMLAAFEGVLIGAPKAASHANVHFEGLIQTVARRGVILPYFKDLTHLFMAVLVTLGGTVCIFALGELIRVYETVSDPDLINASRHAIALERDRMQRLLSSRAILVLIALIAASCGIALYYNGRSDTGWWGNPHYGPAGIYLAVAVSLVIFVGLHALYMLAVSQYSMGRLVSHGIHLRPFHPDGCNGFGKLGNLLLVLLVLCILCATAAWITIWHGYLGIEDFPGIWLAAAGIVVFIPMIVIQPLIRVSTEVRRAQLSRLAPVEQLLNTLLKKSEDELGNADVPKREDMKALREFHLAAKDIYETSVFPFNRKVASVLSVGYIVQAVALAKEIIGKFK